MRNLQQQPAWQEQDLGIPLPVQDHAVSVCLPTWESVLGYEENDERITAKMQLGYPRFFRHPSVLQLFAAAEQHYRNKYEKNTAIEISSEEKKEKKENMVFRSVVFPRLAAAQRAQVFIEKRTQRPCQLFSFADFSCLRLPVDDFSTAMEYWRYTGEIVSSRRAENALNQSIAEISHTQTSASIRKKLTAFTGCRAEDAYLYENGMAANYAAFRAIAQLQPEKKTLQLEFPYVDTLRIQQHFGAGVDYLNQASGAPFLEALSKIKNGDYAAVFCEIPTNPLLHTIDLQQVSAACREGGVPLLVDDTICSSFNVDVSAYADLIITSLTKWFSGVGNVMAGSLQIPKNSPFYAYFSHFLQEDCPENSLLYPKDQTALAANMEHYEARMQQVNLNGKRIADFLQDHPAVKKVWYPSTTQSTLYEQVMQDHPQAGYGGLISFSLHLPENAPKVFDALAISKGPSLGTDFSLACPYTLLAHYDELPWVEECGIPKQLIRLSIGTEPIEQLLALFEKAFIS